MDVSPSAMNIISAAKIPRQQSPSRQHRPSTAAQVSPRERGVIIILKIYYYIILLETSKGSYLSSSVYLLNTFFFPDVTKAN